MKKYEFIPQAAQGTSYFDGIEIMLSEDGDAIHHRHFYYDSDKKITHKISTSEIKYATPSWSKDEEPYFMRHGLREYLSNYMIIEEVQNYEKAL